MENLGNVCLRYNIPPKIAYRGVRIGIYQLRLKLPFDIPTALSHFLSQYTNCAR